MYTQAPPRYNTIMEEIDKLALMAQEMGEARSTLEKTAIALKTNLVNLRSRISLVVDQLERKGTEADLAPLGCLHESGATIDSQIHQLKQQRIYLEQALNTLKLIKLS